MDGKRWLPPHHMHRRGERGRSTERQLQVVVQLGYLPKVARSTWWLRLVYKVVRLCCEGGVRGVRWGESGVRGE